MNQLLATPLGRLRLLAFVEGTSLLMLLFITMPLKYLLGYPGPNYILGMVHGVFFILYVMAVVQVKFSHGWTSKTTLLALLASVIPFGTFWADKKLFRT